MSKNTFYLILGAAIAVWISGISGLVGFAICTALFAAAGYAFELFAALARGFRAGRESRIPKKPALRVIRGGAV